MIETAKLMGICGFYFGMSFQVTHKVMPPDIVQEATAEFVDVGFHEEGLFGMPHTACAASRAWPAALHPGVGSKAGYNWTEFRGGLASGYMANARTNLHGHRKTWIFPDGTCQRRVGVQMQGTQNNKSSQRQANGAKSRKKQWWC